VNAVVGHRWQLDLFQVAEGSWYFQAMASRSQRIDSARRNWWMPSAEQYRSGCT